MDVSSVSDPMNAALAVQQMKMANTMQEANMSVLKNTMDFAEDTMSTLLGSLDSFMQGLGQHVDMQV